MLHTSVIRVTRYKGFQDMIAKSDSTSGLWRMEEEMNFLHT